MPKTPAAPVIRTSPRDQMRNLDNDGDAYTLDIVTNTGREYKGCPVHEAEGEWLDLNVPVKDRPGEYTPLYLRWAAVESVSVNPC